MHLKFFEFLRANLNRLAWFFLILLFLYFSFIFSLFTILKHEIFWTGCYDTGIFDQGIWLLSRFISPDLTVRGMNLFAEHLSFYNVLIAPIFWIWNDVRALFIIQVVIVFLGAFPLFLYARERLKNPGLALFISSLYLIYPALQNMILFEFHPEILTVTFALFMIYFLYKKNFPLYSLFLVLTSIGKEEVSLSLFVFGGFVYFYFKERKVGLVTMVFSLAWFFVQSRVIQPYFVGVPILRFGQKPLILSHWYQPLMANVFNPRYYFDAIFHSESLKYYHELLIPLGYLPLLGVQYFVLAIPGTLINVLSACIYMRGIHFMYNYLQTCFLFLALTEAFYIIRRLTLPSSWLEKIKLPLVTFIVFGFAIVAERHLADFPIRDHFKRISELWRISMSIPNRAIHKALELIPKDASVSAHFSFIPQLSHRRKIFMYPNPFIAKLWNHWFLGGKNLPPDGVRIEYLVLRLNDLDGEEKLLFNYLLDSERFVPIYERYRVMILIKNLTREVSPYNGLNYKLPLKQRGRISMLYFPDSNYYFRNVMGEEVSQEQDMAIEFEGYLAVFEPGIYQFRVVTDGKYLIEVDKVILTPSGKISLVPGLHSLKIKYLGSQLNRAFKVTLISPDGTERIIPDNLLYFEKDYNFFRKQLEIYNRNLVFNRRASNLVPNGNFELIKDGQPLSWRHFIWTEKEGGAKLIVEKELGWDGRHVAKIINKIPSDSRWIQKLQVKPNTFYTLSAHVRVINVPKDGGGAYLEVENSPARTKKLFGTFEWQIVYLVGRTGPDQKEVSIACRLGDYGMATTGAAFFDNIVLKEYKKQKLGAIYPFFE